MSDLAWYLVYTKPRQEQVALLNLENQDYTTYLPLHRYRRRSKGEYRWVTEAYFPRYLFIQLNTETDNWGPIRSTRGVSHIIRFSGFPAKVPDEFIDALRVQHETRLQEVVDTGFQPGQRVEVTEGVMMGYQAVFQERVGAKRAVILLDIADQHTTVQVPVESLEKSK
jgi:transcriptional antiterminator RfaH